MQAYAAVWVWSWIIAPKADLTKEGLPGYQRPLDTTVW